MCILCQNNRKRRPLLCDLWREFYTSLFSASMLYDFFFGYCLFIDNFNHRLAENPQNEKMESKNKIVNLDLFIDWAERKSESDNIMLTFVCSFINIYLSTEKQSELVQHGIFWCCMFYFIKTLAICYQFFLNTLKRNTNERKLFLAYSLTKIVTDTQRVFIDIKSSVGI